MFLSAFFFAFAIMAAVLQIAPGTTTRFPVTIGEYRSRN